jgi:glycosyltransferase involved in cell wall biosynthesis
VARIAYVVHEMSEYIAIELDLLREEHEVAVVECPGRWPRPLEVLRRVAACDVVMSWFASWHAFLPALAARLIGRPMIVTVGGYDTAMGADSGYGRARTGLKRWITRAVLRLATRVIVVSEFTRRETAALGVDPQKLERGWLGLDPARYEDHGSDREDVVITVGGVNRSNLDRKGLVPFVRAAALLPGVRFVLVGAWMDDAIDALRALATPNVVFTGRLPHAEKVDWLRRSRVVVQASRHEAFGLSLAEGMLCGAVPVVTAAGALPEVVGNAGVVIPSPEPSALASGIRRALAQPDLSGRARARVLEHFTTVQRRRFLHDLLARARERSPTMVGT